MTVIMILSGLLSTMSMWADKWDDVRFSMNDVYMIALMTGWSLLFMGLYYRESGAGTVGGALVIASVWAIRRQLFVSEAHYRQGMIPHHSMAVMMSKRLLEKENNIQPFLTNLIRTQEEEIAYLKGQSL